MKRAAILVLVFVSLGFVAGFLVASLTSKVVPTIKEQRAGGPTREVSVDWHVDKYSPGHSLHVINLQLQCDDCHDRARADFKEVDFGVCTACHVEPTTYPHLDHDGQVTDCLTCHAFKFDAEADSPWDCVRCHGPSTRRPTAASRCAIQSLAPTAIILTFRPKRRLGSVAIAMSH